MLADPVEGFLSGIGSGVGRILLALLAVVAGAGVCLGSHGRDLDGSALFFGVVLLPGLLFWWASCGAWVLVGLLALGTLVAAFSAFVLEHRPKLSFFVTFAATALYYAPTCFDEHRWIYALLIFGCCTLLYWFLPPLIARIGGMKN